MYSTAEKIDDNESGFKKHKIIIKIMGDVLMPRITFLIYIHGANFADRPGRKDCRQQAAAAARFKGPTPGYVI